MQLPLAISRPCGAATQCPVEGLAPELRPVGRGVRRHHSEFTASTTPPPRHSRSAGVASLGLGLALSLASLSQAHDFGVSYSKIGLSSRDITISLSINADELQPSVRLDQDGDGFISGHEVLSNQKEIREFLESNISVTKDGHRCAAQADQVTYDSMTSAAETDLNYRCPHGPGAVSIRYDFITTFVHPHRSVANVSLGGQQRSFLFAPDRPLMTVSLLGDEGSVAATESSGAAFASLLSRGFANFFSEVSSLALVLGLALAAVTGFAAIGDVGIFTLGMILSNMVVGLGWVSPPAWIIGPLVSLSVAYVGIENFFPRAVESRLTPAAVIGLLHGAAMALTLSRQAGTVGPLGLAAFDLGLLAAIIVVSAGGHLASRAVGAGKPPLVKVTSMLLISLGTWNVAMAVFPQTGLNEPGAALPLSAPKAYP